MKKRNTMSRADFYKEWLKAARNAYESGNLKIQDYVSLLKIKIGEIKTR